MGDSLLLHPGPAPSPVWRQVRRPPFLSVVCILGVLAHMQIHVTTAQSRHTIVPSLPRRSLTVSFTDTASLHPKPWDPLLSSPPLLVSLSSHHMSGTFRNSSNSTEPSGRASSTRPSAFESHQIVTCTNICSSLLLRRVPSCSHTPEFVCSPLKGHLDFFHIWQL